jgi:hypothetical protein
VTNSGARVRLAYIALALCTIVLGLWVHRGTALEPVVRDVVGDALWAMMITWWIGAVTPRTRLPTRCATAFGICLSVELSQLLHTPSLDALRATTLGRLVLGSGFDPRDIVAYAAGVAVAAACDWSVCARQKPFSLG